MIAVSERAFVHVRVCVFACTSFYYRPTILQKCIVVLLRTFTWCGYVYQLRPSIKETQRLQVHKCEA